MSLRDIPAEIITALGQPVVRPAFFVEILFSEPLRFTSLYSDKVVNGKTYFGFGNLGSVSDVSENSELEPQQMSVVIAGISAASLSGALTEPFINRPVEIAVGLLDDQGQLISDMVMVYMIGKIDDMKVKHDDTGSIEIVVRDRLADWSRPRLERYTNASQQAKFPGDKGLEFVSQVADKEIIWPASSFF